MGEYATRTVELTNRSPSPLFYSISKSRSISSGFLKIPQVCVYVCRSRTVEMTRSFLLATSAYGM